MPTLETESTQADQRLAVAAEVLFLVNLLLLPVLAFFVLAFLYFKGKSDALPLAKNHLTQTVGTSIIGGIALILIIGLTVLLGGSNSGYTWMVVILYFTFIHSTLIFMGVIGLVKAINSQQFTFPVIGGLAEKILPA